MKIINREIIWLKLDCSIMFGHFIGSTAFSPLCEVECLALQRDFFVHTAVSLPHLRGPRPHPVSIGSCKPQNRNFPN